MRGRGRGDASAARECKVVATLTMGISNVIQKSWVAMSVRVCGSGQVGRNLQSDLSSTSCRDAWPGRPSAARPRRCRVEWAVRRP